MDDPFGIVSYVVGHLLDKVVEETKNVICCEENCHALGELLKEIKPLVLDACEKLPTENSASTSGVVQEGPVPENSCWRDLRKVFLCCQDIPDDPVTEAPESSGTHPVKKWLEGLKKTLLEAEKVVSECKVSKWNISKRRSLSRKLLDITQKIKDICIHQVSLATLNVLTDTNQGVGEIRTGLSGLKEQGSETYQAVVQGVEEIKLRLGVPVAADELYSHRKEPTQTFGMDGHLEKLQGLLCGGNSKWVGIYGSGGMGKTLLATRACNSQAVQARFHKHIYWLTVTRNPMVGELLQSLCAKLNISTRSSDPEDELKQKLFNALRQKRVLFILDDVWNDGVPVLNSLDVTSDDTGSKMLVTTREIQVLEEQTAQGIAELNIQCLSKDDSLKMFCQHAWGGVEKIPPELNKELVEAVANECKGLPLALEVIARSQASQKSDVEWKQTLKRLKEAEKLNPSVEIQLYCRLQLSYDALQDVDHRLQKCFLYFAAFPEDSNVHSEKLVELWAGENMFQDIHNTDDDPLEVGYDLLRQLIRRSLIELREERLPYEPKYSNRRQQTCRVHDVLRDLGLHLIKEGKVAPMDCLFSAGKGLDKFPNRWLTPTQPKAQQSGAPSAATSRATHISLSHNQLKTLPAKLEAPRLEVLLLNNNSARWGDDVPRLVISPGFLESFSSLKVLDLHKTVIEFGREIETLGKLTNLIYLNLSKTGLHQVPVQLGKLIKLEFLSLRGCKEIEPWPFDISCLKKLTTLDTIGCKDIWKPQPGLQEYNNAPPTLPPSLDSVCNLKRLQNLSMEGVQENLPPQFSFLVNLCNLQISFKNLKKFPSTLQSKSGSYPRKLKFFSLEDCNDLCELPSCVNSFSCLSHLILRDCHTLASLSNLDKLPKLRILDLKGCYSLQQLPPQLTKKGALPSLEVLNLAICTKLEKFPSIQDGAFPQLKDLWLKGCKSLIELPPSFCSKSTFQSLERLRMSQCTKLENFPSIEDGAFPHLKELWLKGCESLKNLPNSFCSKGAFQSLKELSISNCKKLEKFPSIEDGAFPHLKDLQLTGCESLIELPKSFCSKGTFQSLEELSISYCTKLEKFPSIQDGAFPHLKELWLRGCENLRELPNSFSSKRTFQSLEKLSMSQCTKLEKFPSIKDGAFPRLKGFWLKGCESLTELPNSFCLKGAFPSLEELGMFECKKLEKFPSIEDGALPHLKMLVLDGCESLIELPNSFCSKGAFQSLEELCMSQCTKLKMFPSIKDEAFPHLKKLRLEGNESLIELPNNFCSKGAFQSLEELSMSQCTKLKKFPSVEDGAFSHLKELWLEGCESLTELPSSFCSKGAFQSLEKLSMSQCTRLEKFPSIEDGAFPYLKELRLEGCESLIELPNSFCSKGAFQSLEKLFMSQCTKLEKFPSIEDGVFPHLKELWLTGCESLIELPNSSCSKGAVQSLEINLPN